jgi:hypothetical protein
MGIAPTRILPEPDAAEAAPTDDAPRRAELRAFLMSRRARLHPADVGLPETARRRTPGLRREEVAQLAGLSTEWYTLFEMAKDTGVSRRTIDAVATALRLSPAEQRHLHVLVTGSAQAPLSSDEYVDPSLRDVLDGYQTGPAMLLNARMDVVAENALATAIFGNLAASAEFERNWLYYLFSNHHHIDDWEEQARQLTATFRATLCEHATDAAYSRLLEKLLATSETFRRFWEEHDVSVLDDVPPLKMQHPMYGPLHFRMRVLAQPGAANAFYCCFLIPDDGTAALPAFRQLREGLDLRVLA